MKTTRYIFVCFATILTVNSYALVHQDELSVIVGTLQQRDSYLSPLWYEGLVLGLHNTWSQDFKKRPHWWHQGYMGLDIAMLQNHFHTNMMMNLLLDVGWKAYYRAVNVGGFELGVGPAVGLQLSGRLHVKNVNKPVSVDGGFDGNAVVHLRYSLPRPKCHFGIRYEAQLNLLGCDYLPDYWQLPDEKSIGQNIRFTHLGNRRNFVEQAFVDFLWRSAGVSAGVRHEYNHTLGKGLVMERSLVAFVITVTFNYEHKRLFYGND